MNQSQSSNLVHDSRQLRKNLLLTTRHGKVEHAKICPVFFFICDIFWLYTLLLYHLWNELFFTSFLLLFKRLFLWHFFAYINYAFGSLKCCLLDFMLLLGVPDEWPKSKYHNFKRTQWFSYKTWTKNSEEPIVYLNNWPLPEQHHFFRKYNKKSIFWLLNTDWNAPKKLE